MARVTERQLRSMVGIVSATLAVALATPANAQAPIRIGMSVSLTGTYSALGQNVRRGAQLCINKTNEQGGLLGRKLELVVEDDGSKPDKAISIYEKILGSKSVDLVLSPYSSSITNAVGDVAEKYKYPMIGCCASTASVYQKGRKYLVQFSSPATGYLEGLIDLAAARGMKTVAVIHEKSTFPNAAALGAVQAANKKGLKVVLHEAFPKGSDGYIALLRRVRELKPDVLAAAVYYEDTVAITRKLKELDINPRMFGVTVGGDLPKFYGTLGADAEFIYVPTKWVAELIDMRAGGLVPLSRRYPGASEFAADHKKAFPGADFSYHTAEAYGACQILTGAVKRVGSLDRARIIEDIRSLETNTAFGIFRLDGDGVQIGHKIFMFQWQDGKKAVVWPKELAAKQTRFPTPPWNQR